MVPFNLIWVVNYELILFIFSIISDLRERGFDEVFLAFTINGQGLDLITVLFGRAGGFLGFGGETQYSSSFGG